MLGRLVKFFTLAKNRIVGFFTSGEKKLISEVIASKSIEAKRFNDYCKYLGSTDITDIEVWNDYDDNEKDSIRWAYWNFRSTETGRCDYYKIYITKIIAVNENSRRPYDCYKVKKNVERMRNRIQFEISFELLRLAKSKNVKSIERIRQLLEMRINPGNEQSSKMRDPNVQDYKGNTALHRAIKARNLPVIELLLDHGANVLIKNDDNITPFDLIDDYVRSLDLSLMTHPDLLLFYKCLSKVQIVKHNNVVQELRDIGVLKGLETINFDMAISQYDRPISSSLLELSVKSLAQYCAAR